MKEHTTEDDARVDPVGRDPDAAESHEDALQADRVGFLVIRSGDCLYGVTQDDVAFIDTVGSPLPIPTSPDHLLGAVHRRGRVIVVCDLHRLLDVNHAGGDKIDATSFGSRLIVLRSTGSTFAVVADSTVGHRTVAADQIRHSLPDPPGKVRNLAQDLFAGHFDLPEGVVAILHVGALLEALHATTRRLRTTRGAAEGNTTHRQL